VIQLRLFGRCRIYHDPVAPVLKALRKSGGKRGFGKIDLVTPRNLKGKELLMRTPRWWDGRAFRDCGGGRSAWQVGGR